MTAAYRLHHVPDVHEPVLVVMLAGWIDAGSAAAVAVNVLVEQLGVRRVATFDPDAFLDFRARRPVLQLRDGVNTRLVWPEIVLDAGRDADGHDVLVLTGHEPDAQWFRFCDAVAGLAVRFGVRLAVGLGAYPYAAPHTRPSRLSVTCSTPEVAATMPYLRSSVDVPAGVAAALERRFADLGIPAVGLWAQVPHYVAAYPYPAATLSLLTGLAEVAGISVDVEAVQAEADRHRAQLDALVANSSEHLAMVRQLEQEYDAQVLPGAVPLAEGVPSGDEIAAELERFLREQGA